MAMTFRRFGLLKTSPPKPLKENQLIGAISREDLRDPHGPSVSPWSLADPIIAAAARLAARSSARYWTGAVRP
jgi:hypothetical protein